MRRVVYAGHIEIPEWGVGLRKGKHDGLISFETFTRIHERLEEGARAPARKDISEDFPLRGFVGCACCGNPLTANWSRSKTGKRHAYYHCYNKACEVKGKSIRRGVIDEAFHEVLKRLEPAPVMHRVITAMFKDAWAQRAAQAKDAAAILKAQIAETDRQITKLVDRIVETDNERLVKSYEMKLDALEKQKLLLAEKQVSAVEPHRPFGEMFELAMDFLANPWKIWENGSSAMRRTVLRLVFPERILFDREEGFRTPKTTLPFKYLEEIVVGKTKMAERGGLHLHTRLLIEISEHAIARSIAMCTSVVLSFQASRNDRSRVADLDFEDLSTLPPDQAERSAPLSLKARARTICGDVDSRRRNRRYASRDHPDRDWRNLRDLALVGALLAGSLLFHVTILREEPRRTTEPRTAAGTR